METLCCIYRKFFFFFWYKFLVTSRNGINFKKFTFRLFSYCSCFIVSLGTYVADSNLCFFWNLHLLSVCTLLGLLIYKLPVIVILIIGFLILFLEPHLISEIYKPKYLAWKFIYWSNRISGFLWFFPLVQFIFGLGISKIIFKKKSNFLNSSSLKIFKQRFFSKLFWLGKKFLIVYLIHQPFFDKYNLYI